MKRARGLRPVGFPETCGATNNIDASAQNRIIQIPGANATCGEDEAARVRPDTIGASASVLLLQLAG